MQAPTVEGMSPSELEGHIGDHVGVSSAVCCAVDYFGPSDFRVMDDQSERDKGHKLVHDGPGEARKATLFCQLTDWMDFAIRVTRECVHGFSHSRAALISPAGQPSCICFA
jgi:hypothetical protein